jgi:hypothetical protein
MIGRSFDLKLGTPSAGWLPITIRVGERVYETAASSVLNDPLDELVDAAVALRRDDPLCASVRLWEEPAWKELRFTAERGDEDVVIELSDTDRRTLMSKAAGKRDAVATFLAGELAIFEEGLPRTGAVDGWGVFPSMKLRQVTPGTERVYAPPWKEARGLERVIDELRVESGASHPLHGVEVEVVAANLDAGEYLLETKTGSDAFAVVRLRWSGQRERDLPVQFFRSWAVWAQRHMRAPKE